MSSSCGGGVASRPRKSPYPMLDVDSALQLLFDKCTPTEPVSMSFERSFGHVLAEDVIAVEPYPPFPASIKDGYAVLASDGIGPRKLVSVSIAGASQMTAAYPGSGECVRVSTGAPVPLKADAVVQVEDTELIDKDTKDEEVAIVVRVSPTIGQDIRPIGSDIAAGQTVLSRCSLIGSSDVGLLAMIGRKTVVVHPKPKVAVLSTGNEVEDVGEGTPVCGKIRDSNRPELLTLFNDFGFEPTDVGIAGDSEISLINVLTCAFNKQDVVVASGGVSMGEKDLLKPVLENTFHFTVHFGRVKMKPGKPTTFASGVFNGRTKYVFALPGNPVSAWVTAHLFVIPALRCMCGYRNRARTEINVVTLTDLKLDPVRVEYQRAVFVSPAIDNIDGLAAARITDPNQMSSRLTNSHGANLLLRLPIASEGKSALRAGEIVRALVIDRL